METRLWNVYLSGEIHTDWRDQILHLVEKQNIAVRLMTPELDHQTSDECGKNILGDQPDPFWYDHQSAKINTIRNRGVIKNCDIMIVRFGEKYRQWNAAYDAGLAVALGLSLITLHDSSLDHALKEIDAMALAVTREPEQVVEILKYITSRPF